MRVLIVEDGGEDGGPEPWPSVSGGSPWTWRTTASTVPTWRSMAEYDVIVLDA